MVTAQASLPGTINPGPGGAFTVYRDAFTLIGHNTCRFLAERFAGPPCLGSIAAKQRACARPRPRDRASSLDRSSSPLEDAFPDDRGRERLPRGEDVGICWIQGQDPQSRSSLVAASSTDDR